ncbi:MAG: hypothetical protein JO340_19735 [Acidobacteriaceae bacterium]|nr:hypothetical protein [Acidobacteriaceae bacterium]
MSGPSSGWDTLFKNVGAQGAKFDRDPLSPTGQYYGFLSSVEFDQTTKTYDVLFELVQKEWNDNAVIDPDTEIRAPAPFAPALLYHIRDIAEEPLLEALGLATPDNLAEGSWYLLTLQKGKDTVTGDLYDPDIDLLPST